MALTGLKSSSRRKDKSKSSKRKLEKRLQFHTKVQDASRNLGVKQTINKKKRLRRRQKKLKSAKAYDLSALSEFLPDLGCSQNPANTTHTKLNCKSRQKLLQRESAQMRAVLNNPVFQMDPIAAIQRHLETTQPPSATATAHLQEGKPNKQGKAKKKKAKAKKKGSESSMMDI